MAHPKTHFARPSMTIIEVIVVIILIALLAGLVAPRLGNVALRRAENEANAVLGILTSVAQRDAMTSQAYAIAYDAATSRFALLALRDAPGPNQAPQWMPAPLQTPLVLEAAEIRSAAIDGRVVQGSFTVEFRPGQARPTVSILVVPRDGVDARGWQIELGPAKLAARMEGLADAGAWQPAAADVQDLDNEGMREDAW